MPASENLHRLGSRVTQSRLPLFPQQQTFLSPAMTSKNLHNSGSSLSFDHVVCARWPLSFGKTSPSQRAEQCVEIFLAAVGQTACPSADGEVGMPNQQFLRNDARLVFAAEAPECCHED